MEPIALRPSVEVTGTSLSQNRKISLYKLQSVDKV